MRCCLTRAKYKARITALVLLAPLFLTQARSHWPSWPPGHTAVSCSACCPSVPSGPFLPGHCSATLSPSWNAVGFVLAKVQDPAFGPVKPHLAGFGPWVQPVKITLQSLLPSRRSTCPANLVTPHSHVVLECSNGLHDSMRPPSVTMCHGSSWCPKSLKYLGPTVLQWPLIPKALQCPNGSLAP